jgi:hypothetical protein
MKIPYRCQHCRPENDRRRGRKSRHGDKTTIKTTPTTKVGTLKKFIKTPERIALTHDCVSEAAVAGHAQKGDMWLKKPGIGGG